MVEPHAEQVVMCTPRARIHISRGEHDLAVAVAGRGLRELVGDAARRGPLLALTVQAELGRGDPDAADRAGHELAALADRTDSPALHGEAALAQGRVAAARGDLDIAATNLADAVRSFDRNERPLQSAMARLELAEALAADGIRADAIVEARTALAVFTRLGAGPQPTGPRRGCGCWATRLGSVRSTPPSRWVR